MALSINATGRVTGLNMHCREFYRPKEVRKYVEQHEANILPTVLHLKGLPRKKDMLFCENGNLLEKLFEVLEVNYTCNS